MLLFVLSSSKSLSWTLYIHDPVKLLTLCTVFSHNEFPWLKAAGVLSRLTPIEHVLHAVELV